MFMEEESLSQGMSCKPMKTVVLIECGKIQYDHPVISKELYKGTLFKKSWANAAKNFPSADKFILSTKHYLLDPNTVTSPYNVTFNAMTKAQKQAWANTVISQLQGKGYNLNADEFIFYAGKDYSRYLVAPLGPIKNFRLMFAGCKGIGEILHSL